MKVAEVAIGCVLFVGAVIFVLLANHQVWELQFELNECLPQVQRFDPTWWTISTHLRLLKLQKAVLPQSARPKKALVMGLCGLALFVGSLAVFGIARL